MFTEDDSYVISSDSDEESKIIERDSTIVNKVLLSTDPVQSLGSWEKHTKVLFKCVNNKMYLTT